jgi:hypothetical protein
LLYIVAAWPAAETIIEAASAVPVTILRIVVPTPITIWPSPEPSSS